MLTEKKGVTPPQSDEKTIPRELFERVRNRDREQKPSVHLSARLTGDFKLMFDYLKKRNPHITTTVLIKEALLARMLLAWQQDAGASITAKIPSSDGEGIPVDINEYLGFRLPHKN